VPEPIIVHTPGDSFAILTREGTAVLYQVMDDGSLFVRDAVTDVPQEAVSQVEVDLETHLDHRRRPPSASPDHRRHRNGEPG